MPLEPLTAGLEFATELTRAYITFWTGATPIQREQLVQFFIDDRKLWQPFLDRLIALVDRKSPPK